MSERPRTLVVEDTPTQAELARALLVALGHEVRIVGAAGPALNVARDWAPDLILLDVDLPDYSGFELIRQLRAEDNETTIVVVTADGALSTAVQAIKLGAADFIPKPYSKARLQVTLGNVLELQRRRTQNPADSFKGFIGASEKMRAMYRTIQAVAGSNASVFITGESGTGKELAAEAVHRASGRASRSFVALNCGAIPRDLLESEVFGHVKGAFTGAIGDRIGAARQADGGTLFLDEIGEMPLEMQVKLLRFVQTGTFQPVGSSKTEHVDVRFVCATNRDPLLEVQAGRFREDLYYRLYVVSVELPPLRDRGDDVLLIARKFLQRFSKDENRRFRRFSEAAEQALMAYAWPGNVRQLQNVVRNVVVLHDGEVVERAMLPPPLGHAASVVAPSVSSISGMVAAALPKRPVVGGDWTGVADTAAVAARSGRMPWEIPNFTPDNIPASMRPAAAESAPSSPEPPAKSRPLRPRSAPPPPPEPAPAQPAEPEIVPLAVMERRLILAALAHTNQDVSRAAALLQVNPSTVYRKLQSWRAEGLLP